ncbi:MAG: hypothetical protein UX91_C0001G0095 [Candidatus Amesbacteria bacterium GW2011_GWB1_47_19]|nr:MAG: hypothetical protein UW51_C0001G0095 [Candidatus Amesbacteria bacterium GW2011_GWA1_44_24]KKU32107.1 MAG: hypothetical protein UX46_C0001G0094 [Candidatus Amesbacteria bacterium GW2011_GWC1_46_24]KKU67791.1 MAG: hypothetical protein UX91_C0001G0095 [Candidatus Amesbacteria bacterium GW2011_GWB1_47_19]OGD06022.1 MAG: hypothetical protein A2379_02930 [Candidatus Amesbacteria bacterium RIFOXYB1_FULL_47_13]HBC72389.1 hypothetical protein [Candidatus Amesbacteria bacterium]
MASPQPCRSSSLLLSALRYSDRFDYPLTLEELWFWQIRTHFSKLEINRLIKNYKFKIENYCFLPHRQKLIPIRRQREIYSRKKWLIARRVGESLRRFPTIRAVFITGALAMNNCPENDDIDIMVITIPHTLWITRFILYLYLSPKSYRRPPRLPEHSSPRVRDKICDNLYLDYGHLNIRPQNLYTAHEILQARPLFDKSSIHHQFLAANPWASEYLPVAYQESLKKFGKSNLIENCKLKIENLTWLLYPLNLFFFLLQYLYMKPKMTSEHIGLGFAFFHPNSQRNPS